MTIETTSLDNGLRVVTHAMPHLQTASLGVWVDAGARCEHPQENGLSHLLEHLAFKGTGKRTAMQIAEEIEAAGGDMNAATAMESTAYFARVLKEDVPLAVDILSDILLDPVFDPAELERERRVIVQEIGAARDTPEDVVFELAQACAYPDQALGRSILGTEDTVTGFDAGAVAAYRDRHYAAPAMVLAAAGAVDHGALVDLARHAFDGVGREAAPKWTPARYRGGAAFEEKPFDQTHIVVGFGTEGYRHDQFYALQVMSNALGGGMSSRLFQEVREKRGLCYAVGSFATAYSDTGLFGVYAATSPDLTPELTSVLTDELRRFADDVSDEEVARARAQLKAGLMMSLESSSSRADQMARQMLAFDRVLEIDKITARVDAIDRAAVSDLAGRLIANGNPVYSAVGDLNTVASYDRIAAQFA